MSSDESQILLTDLDRDFDWKWRRIFRQPDQFLIVDRERADFRWLPQPVGLRIGRGLWNFWRKIFREQFVLRKRSIDPFAVAGNWRRTSTTRTGTLERLIASNLIGNIPPGVTVDCSVEASI